MSIFTPLRVSYKLHRAYYLSFTFHLLLIISITICIFSYFTLKQITTNDTKFPIYFSPLDKITLNNTLNFTPSNGTIITTPCVYPLGNYSLNNLFYSQCPPNFTISNTKNYCESNLSICSNANFTGCYPQLFKYSNIVNNSGDFIFLLSYSSNYSYLPLINYLIIYSFLFILFCEFLRILLYYIKVYLYSHQYDKYYYSTDTEDGEDQTLLPKQYQKTIHFGTYKIRVPLHTCYIFGFYLPTLPRSHDSYHNLYTYQYYNQVIIGFVYSSIIWLFLISSLCSISIFYAYNGYSIPSDYLSSIRGYHCLGNSNNNLLNDLIYYRHIFTFLMSLLFVFSFARIISLYKIITSNIPVG